MQRYMLTEYEAASPETRAVYDDFMRMTGATSPPVWIKSMGHSAALARSYWERAKGTLFSGQLPLPLKEMIVFIVSARNGAKYCSACHAQSVLKLDKAMSFDSLQALLRDAQSIQLPASYKTVIQFASKVACDANQITDEDYQDLMDEGFSLEEICEIVSVIDLATMFNVYTSTLRLHLDSNYRAII